MNARSETERLKNLQDEITSLRHRERELDKTRRAVLNLLEDLDEDRGELIRAEQLWHAAFDGIRDAIFIHDADLRIVRANRAYLEWAGATEEQAIGRVYWELFPKGSGPIPGCRERGVVESDLPVGRRIYRSRAYVVYGAAGEYGFSLHFFEDVTERRRAEEQIRQRTEQLAASNVALERALAELKTAEDVVVRTEKLAAIGTMASSVAHELNNPLMGVMNYVSYASEKMQDEKGRDVLQKAARELDRMEGVVRNLLVLGRPAGDVLQPLDAREALSRSLDLLAADLRGRQVKVVTHWPDDLPRVWGGVAPLQQVFINLILNAAAAMEHSTRKEIRIEGSVAGDRVRIVVADTGHGVPEEVRPHLFEPFFSTRPEGQGTGLGLPISQKILDSFGGSLEFDPTHVPGAAFILTLRMARGL